ncbi:hypothetical protein T06_2060 [Trichinella sp. T6]|nr:hypothetical protein T06_8516 [Trichinella sp. T6]KRX65140.1 hypothetical protein T06_6482 [Trichinella sp. T6]KRX69282.1 hypothetical protein T06_2060 [Trichinella sp. T6]
MLKIFVQLKLLSRNVIYRSSYFIHLDRAPLSFWANLISTNSPMSNSSSTSNSPARSNVFSSSSGWFSMSLSSLPESAAAGNSTTTFIT